MLNKKKLIISWLLVIIWAIVIFFMSNMNSNVSNKSSVSTINEFIEKSIDITNELGITDKHPSENKMNQVVNKLNYPLRKVAHASEYFVFALLIINALKSSGINNKIYIITVLICFIYASTDEFHQIFVNGRTGHFVDVLIDTFGSFIGTILFTFKKN